MKYRWVGWGGGVLSGVTGSVGRNTGSFVGTREYWSTGRAVWSTQSVGWSSGRITVSRIQG
jgi:hypothetical protein